MEYFGLPFWQFIFFCIVYLSPMQMIVILLNDWFSNYKVEYDIWKWDGEYYGEKCWILYRNGNPISSLVDISTDHGVIIIKYIKNISDPYHRHAALRLCIELLNMGHIIKTVPSLCDIKHYTWHILIMKLKKIIAVSNGRYQYKQLGNGHCEFWKTKQS